MKFELKLKKKNVFYDNVLILNIFVGVWFQGFWKLFFGRFLEVKVKIVSDICWFYIKFGNWYFV